MDAGTVYSLGIGVIFAGMLVILVAILLLFLSSVKGEEKVKAKGATIIGPFPIILGTDKKSIKTILLLSITISVLLVIVMVMFCLMSR